MFTIKAVSFNIRNSNALRETNSLWASQDFLVISKYLAFMIKEREMCSCSIDGKHPLLIKGKRFFGDRNVCFVKTFHAVGVSENGSKELDEI